MFDWEIKNLIDKENGNINSIQYSNIIDTSPQINHVHYEPWNDTFKMWSKNGNEFNFKVHYKKNN